MNRMIRVLGTLLLLAVSRHALSAQTSLGQIAGTISDATGTLIPTAHSQHYRREHPGGHTVTTDSSLTWPGSEQQSPAW